MRGFEKLRRRRILLLAGLAIAHGSVAATATWQKLESDELAIYTDVSGKEAMEFAVGYSAYRAAFKQWLMPEGARLPRSTVVLFRRSRDFQRHAEGKPDDDYRLIVTNVEIDGAALTALALEGNRQTAFQHAFEFETVWALRRVGYSLPLWMSQGTGEVFSSLLYRKGRWWFGDQPDRFDGDVPWLGWDRFFSVYPGSSEYRGKKANGAYHEQAWAVMHRLLLQTGADGRARFAELAGKLRQATNDQAVLEAMWGEPAGSFRQSISRHLREASEPVAIAFDEAAVRAGFKTGPAPETEVKVQQANLLAAAGKEAEAGRLLDELYATSPDSAAVLEAMARRSYRQDRADDAIEFYRRAIAAGSTNPNAYLRSAGAYLDETAGGGPDLAGSGGNVVIQSLAIIRQAIALDPGNERAFRLLGRALFVSPTVTAEDIAELSRGISNSEDGLGTLFYRGLLHDRLHLTAGRNADLHALAENPHADASTRREAKTWLAKAVFDETRETVNDLVKAGDFDRARAVLSAAMAEETGDDVVEGYRKLEAWLVERADWEQLRQMYNAHKWVEAQVAAEAFIRRYPKSPALRDARQILDRARSELKRAPSI